MRTMLSLCITFFILATVCACVHATCEESAAGVTLFSAWASKPTSADKDLIIPEGVTIVLDESPPKLAVLTIKGTLVVKTDASVKIDLKANEIYVEGHMIVGSKACPVLGNVTITLFGDRQPDVSPLGTGTKCIGVLNGGVLDMHGKPIKNTWTRLNGNVARGADSITTVDDIGDWPVDAKFVIASSEYAEPCDTGKKTQCPNMGIEWQSETRFITGATEKSATFKYQPLKHEHYGKIYVPDNAIGDDSIDMRAEVGLLSRNIVIKGDTSGGACVEHTPGVVHCWGAHVMIVSGGEARFAFVEFTHVGQGGEKARYPIHYHVARNQANSYVEGCSFHDTFQRCITVHGSDKLLIRDNVAYNSTGHCYFIEDADETENVFAHNLGVEARKHTLMGSDSEPSIFWITHPRNHFYDNAAVGGTFGFWYAMPKKPTGFGKDGPLKEDLVRWTLCGDFQRNTAHSCRDTGLFIDRGQENDDGDANNLSSYIPRDFSTTYNVLNIDATDLIKAASWKINVLGQPRFALFEDFTAYKCGVGMWGRGEHMMVKRFRSADNQVACSFPGTQNLMIDSVFIGDSDNHRTPVEGEVVSWVPVNNRLHYTWYDYKVPLVGYRNYDASGGDLVQNTHFYNFNDLTDVTWTVDGKVTQNLVRKAGAISAQTGPNVLAPINRFQNVKFVSTQNNFFLYPKEYDVAMTGFAIVDYDGSISGTCGAQIIGHGEVMRTNKCTHKPSWNAYLCVDDVARRLVVLEDLDKTPLAVPKTTVGEEYLAKFTRVSDGVSGLTLADLDPYTETDVYVERRWVTNLVANNEYLFQAGKHHDVPQRLNIAVHGGLTRGEWYRFVVPYPSGTTITKVTGDYDTSKALPMEASLAALDAAGPIAWYFDTPTTTLHVHMTRGSDLDFLYVGDRYPVATSVAIAKVTAVCPSGSCKIQDAAFTATEHIVADNTPSKLCQDKGPGENNGEVSFDVATSPAPISFFSDDAWMVGYTLQSKDSKCRVDPAAAQGGSTNGIFCDIAKPYAWFQFVLGSANVLDVKDYTHLRFSLRAAPTFGHDNKLIVHVMWADAQLKNMDPLPGPLVDKPIISNPSYGKGHVTEHEWRTYVVPLEHLDMDVAAGRHKVFGIQWNVQSERPCYVYMDNVEFIKVDKTNIVAPAQYPYTIETPPLMCKHERCDAKVLYGPTGTKPATSTTETEPDVDGASTITLSVVLILFVTLLWL